MSNSDYTTIGEVSAKNSDNNKISDDQHDNNQIYIEKMDKYPVFFVILAIVLMTLSTIAVSYAIFKGMQVKDIVSMLLIFGAIFTTALFYLIDMYREYRSWSNFGEKLHEFNTRTWNGEDIEYPERKKNNFSLWKTAIPSCAVLISSGLALFLFSIPSDQDNESSMQDPITTTVTVPGEGAKEVVLTPGDSNASPNTAKEKPSNNTGVKNKTSPTEVVSNTVPPGQNNDIATTGHSSSDGVEESGNNQNGNNNPRENGNDSRDSGNVIDKSTKQQSHNENSSSNPEKSPSRQVTQQQTQPQVSAQPQPKGNSENQAPVNDSAPVAPEPDTASSGS